MIIAINLISKVFIMMLICFCLFELLTMGSFILLSQIPLKKNIKNIQSVSLDNAKEIATSFSQLMSGTFANIRTDLLLFVKHIDVYHKNDYYLYLNPDSVFNKSYDEECLYNKENSPNSSLSYKTLINEIDFVDSQSETIIENLFKKDYLSKGYYYSKSAPTLLYNKSFICYALSFLKSVIIRNIIMHQQDQIMLNFTMLLGDNIVFYPAVKFGFEEIIMLPHYNDANSSCGISYNYYCLSNTYLEEKHSENEIYSFAPILRNNSIITNFCIKFTGPDNDNHLLFTTVNITQIISNITIPSDNVVLNLVKVNKTQGLELLYSSAMDMKDVNELFNKKEFDIHQLKSPGDKLSLFHSLYYKLAKIAKLSDHDIRDIVLEYNNNLNKVNEVINKYENNELKDHQDIEIIQTSIQYLQRNGSEIITEYSYRPDLYNYYIAPIVVKNTHYTQRKVFDTNTESNYLYLIISLKIGNSVYSNNVYWIFTFRAIKSLLLTLGELVVGCILVFVLFQYVVTVLLYPLNIFQDVIHSIVDRKKEIEKAKAGIMINEERVKIPFDETSIKDEYTSKEIQSIGKLIIFLNQIVNLKDSKTSNIQRAKLYLSISEYIQNQRLEKFKSNIIVAKYYIKESDNNDLTIDATNNNVNKREYQKAIDLLEGMQKAFEEKENEIISQNDDIEQKSAALSQTKGIYINDYNYERLCPNAPWVSLQFIKQNYHFVLGQAYYYSFIDLHKKQKSKDEDLKHFYHDKQENEKLFFLSQAIDNFKKASRINDHLQINSIKNIIIYLYLSKCYYYYQNDNQKTEASKMLKKSIVSFVKFFKMIRELTEDSKTSKFFVDPRIILMISGILMEDILYSIGHFAKKMNKNKTAFDFLTKIFSISYYKNHHIHQKAIHIMEKILRLSNQKKNIAYKKLSKLEIRLSVKPKRKVMFIIISENFIENYHSLESFRVLVKNCLMKYLDNKDLIGYIYLAKEDQVKESESPCNKDGKATNIGLFEKLDAMKEIDNHILQLILKKSNQIIINQNNSKSSNNSSKIHLGNSFEIISSVCKEKRLYNVDLYCFAFAKLKDIRFSSDSKAKKIFEEFYHKNASIYIYCFNKEIPEDKVSHYKKFFNHFSEGVIVLVKNFKMIKLGFENISNLQKQHNLLSIDYSNTDNLLY